MRRPTGSRMRDPDLNVEEFWLCNALIAGWIEVLARATIPRYTNYTFVSSYGAITYAFTF